MLKVKHETHRFTHNVAFFVAEGLVGLLQVPVGVVLYQFDLVSSPFQSQVGQVLPLVDPVPDCPLDSKHDRNQDFLNHFRVLNPLRVSQNLLNCRINFRPPGLFQLVPAPHKHLYFADGTQVVQLVYFQVELLLEIGGDFQKPLNFESCLLAHFEDCTKKCLGFHNAAVNHKGQDTDQLLFFSDAHELHVHSVHVDSALNTGHA